MSIEFNIAMGRARSRPTLSRLLAGLLMVAPVAGARLAEGSTKPLPQVWLPAGIPEAPAEGPALCQRDFLTPEQGAAVLTTALQAFPDCEAWEAYADRVRERIQEGAGLAPWPKRTPLKPIVRDRRLFDGYSVENVAFESVPGFFAAGNLYRPLDAAPPHAAVVSTHGHTRGIKQPADYANHGRFTENAQKRAAGLARMGAVVFAIDMFGYGDSIQQVGQEPHKTDLAMTMQVWNAIRAVDFLSSLEDVDPARIAVTGESGGGTQAFLLAALDDRVAVSVPVVMVSSYFFGGCVCESGRPIHRSADHFASNAIIAALAAPRPMLVVSDGKDWTQHVPAVEFPFLQEIYGRFGARGNVANAHFEAEGHDYGPSKRAAMYRFMAERLELDLQAVQDDAGAIDESRLTVEPPEAMRVFIDAESLPAHALRDAASVSQALKNLQH